MPAGKEMSWISHYRFADRDSALAASAVRWKAWLEASNPSRSNPNRKRRLAAEHLGPPRSAEELARLDRQHTLELSRTRLPARPRPCKRAGARAMLEQAIAALDAELDALQDHSAPLPQRRTTPNRQLSGRRRCPITAGIPRYASCVLLPQGEVCRTRGMSSESPPSATCITAAPPTRARCSRCSARSTSRPTSSCSAAT